MCNFRRVKLKMNVAVDQTVAGRQWIMSSLNVVPFDIVMLLHEMNFVLALESLRSLVSMYTIDLTIYLAHDLMYSNCFLVASMKAVQLG